MVPQVLASSARLGSRRHYGELLFLGATMLLPALVVAALALMGVQQIGFQPGGGHGGALTGQVLDLGGSPLKGAHVTLRQVMGSAAPLRSVTDRAGRYTLRAPAGEYVLEARRDGYAAEHELVSTFDSLPVRRDVTLQPGGTVSGRVLRRGDDTPVAFATVRALTDAGRSAAFLGWSEVKTDAAGAFQLTDLPAGSLRLLATTASAASRTPVVLSLGVAARVSDVRVWVEPAFALSGVVLEDAPNSPKVEGIRVIALSTLGGAAPQPASAVTDGSGRFVVPALPPGDYLLHAWSDSVRRPVSLGAAVRLPEADVREHLLTLRSGKRLSGRLNPPMQAQVQLWSLEPGGTPEAFAPARTNANGAGEFTFDHLPPGRFEVSAQTATGLTARSSVAMGQAETPELRLTLAAGVHLTGRIADDRGKPVADAWLELVRVPKQGSNSLILQRAARVRTSQDGAFELRSLLPAAYELRLRDRFGERTWVTGLAGGERQRIEIDKTSAKRPLQLRARSCQAVLRGAVVNEDGSGVAHASVTLRREDASGIKLPALGGWSERTLLAKADGRFEVTGLCPGSYRVEASSPSGESMATERALPDGAPLRLALRRPSTLLGRIGQRGAPVSAYELHLGGPVELQQHVSSLDGSFRVDGLPAGSYEIFVSSRDGYVLESLWIEHGSSPAALELELRPWSVLRGRILRPSGAAWTGAQVTAVFEPPGGQATDLLGPLLRIQHTSANALGEFEFPRVVPGRGYLAFDHAGERLLLEGQTYSDQQPALTGRNAWQPFLLKPGEAEDVGALRARP